MEIVTHCSVQADLTVPKPQSPRATLKVLKLGFDLFLPGPHVNTVMFSQHWAPRLLPARGWKPAPFPCVKLEAFLFLPPRSLFVLGRVSLPSLIHSAYIFQAATMCWKLGCVLGPSLPEAPILAATLVCSGPW